MTPGEFTKTTKGMQSREEEKLSLLALLVAELNAPHVKRPKAPKWYLDRWTKKADTISSKEEKFRSLLQKVKWKAAQDAIAAERARREGR